MSVRTEKVAEEIKHRIAGLISSELEKDEAGLVTVTRVRVSPDLRIAKVYMSFIGNKLSAEECIEKINYRKKQIRMNLSSKIHLRFMPDLFFYHDDTIEYASRINEILKEINKGNDKSEKSAG
ncbi:MAG: 30S ribosome-binding factor RbfA [Ignavibacteria bacterium]|nr:30S ribosome-binding factor RbfA [Ignavibacteria bacterium]